MIKCIVFDLGDTLIGTSKGVKKTLNAKVEIKELRKAGYKIKEEEYDSAFKLMNKQVSKIKTPKKHAEYLPAFLIIKNLGIKPNWKLAKRLAKKFFECQRKNTKLEPNAKQVLTFLKKKKIKIALISNAGTGKAKRWLKIFKLSKFFEVILISESVGFEKSQIIPFKIFLKQINKNRKTKILPKECLMIGNDAIEDASAKKVGMKTALYAPKKAKKQKQLLKPDYKIKNLKDIIIIVEKENKKVP